MRTHFTPLDIRLKYRFDTGEAPTYGRTSGQQAGSCNYKGGLTHEYAEWLESHVKASRSRRLFQMNTGLVATYYDKNRILRYVREYKEWMEEQFCTFQSFAAKMKESANKHGTN